MFETCKLISNVVGVLLCITPEDLVKVWALSVTLSIGADYPAWNAFQLSPMIALRRE